MSKTYHVTLQVFNCSEATVHPLLVGDHALKAQTEAMVVRLRPTAGGYTWRTRRGPHQVRAALLWISHSVTVELLKDNPEASILLTLR